MITREGLESRLKAMVANKDQHLANANACGGAIQVLEQLLKEWDAPDDPPKEG